MRLENRVILICGHLGPVERRIALNFSQHGAQIMIASSDAEAGAALQTELDARGASATFMEYDGANESSIQALVGDAVMTYGALDGLINSGLPAPAGDALEVDGSAWDRAFDRQVRGAWLAARAALPFLKPSKGATILNLARTDALQTQAQSMLAAATSGALDAMTRSMAIDFGPLDIRVNTLLIGYIETDETRRTLSASPESEFHRLMAVHPLGRLGRPSDVANAALFLMGSESSFITGATLIVDGGRSIVSQNLYI
ncbi:MAG: SDR family oxidoreductase [Planctomycetota bacterium]